MIRCTTRQRPKTKY